MQFLDFLQYAIYKDLIKGNWINEPDNMLFKFKTRNQLNLNKMNNLTTEQKEKLERTNCVAKQISELKESIGRVSGSHKLSSPNVAMYFQFGDSDVQIKSKYINFKSIQAQVLASMRKELKDLEKEFESI